MAGAPVSCTIISPPAAAYSQAAPFQMYTEADQKLTVQILDISGKPADPTCEITFECERGSVDPDPAPITAPLNGTATAVFRSDQPTPVGVVDHVRAVCEGVVSDPLHVFIEVNPAL